MKMVKSLLLGTAAGLLAVAGAQAADMPVKAKPVEYVKICSLYGAGFYYIPGTDTCLKIGGYVRVQTELKARRQRPSRMAPAACSARAATTSKTPTTSTTRSVRSRPSMRARRPNTARLRSYIRAGWNQSTPAVVGRRHHAV